MAQGLNVDSTFSLGFFVLIAFSPDEEYLHRPPYTPLPEEQAR